MPAAAKCPQVRPETCSAARTGSGSPILAWLLPLKASPWALLGGVNLVPGPTKGREPYCGRQVTMRLAKRTSRSGRTQAAASCQPQTGSNTAASRDRAKRPDATRTAPDPWLEDTGGSRARRVLLVRPQARSPREVPGRRPTQNPRRHRRHLLECPSEASAWRGRATAGSRRSPSRRSLSPSWQGLAAHTRAQTQVTRGCRNASWRRCIEFIMNDLHPPVTFFADLSTAEFHRGSGPGVAL